MNELAHQDKLRHWSIVVAMIAAVAYFLLSLRLLQTGHLHEDAYILFEYVRHFIAGDGIVYFAGGGHAEGATDFLWFMLLSLLAFLHVDVGVAAAMLNALGVFGILVIILRTMPFSSVRKGLFFYGFMALLVVASPLAAASIGGFSTLFYVAVSLVLVNLYWQDNKAKLVYLPLVAIVLGLIRPDGVIVGFVFCLLGLFDVLKTPHLRNYLFTGTVAAIIGIVYFIWRYNYFGHLLPLPLYVKAYHASLDSGWVENFNWLDKTKVMILVVTAVFAFNFPVVKRVKAIKLLLPVIALFVSLGMTHQSQNMDFRFQGPVWGCILFLFSMAIFHIAEHAKFKGHVILACVILLVIIQPYAKRLDRVVSVLQRTDYINYLPMILAKTVDKDTKIALTEAGRMAYWNNAQTYDLIGLNTVYTAINRVDPDYLRSLKPDMIFIHTAGTLASFDRTESYFHTDIAEILQHVKPEYAAGWKAAENPVIRSPLSVFSFLQENAGYEIFMVRDGEEYWHLYAIRHDGSVAVESFISALEKSMTPIARKSYLQAIASSD